MTTQTTISRLHAGLCAATLLSLAACGTAQKAPATADVAVSRSAVDNGVSAGATELFPQEIRGARSTMMRANEALAAKNYALARTLATQAQADARLAQSKANSTKANAAVNALDADLREEVDRNR